MGNNCESFGKETSYDSLLKVCKPGDVLEMNSATECHPDSDQGQEVEIFYGVYVGHGQIVSYVATRRDVITQALADVLLRCNVKINNGLGHMLLINNISPRRREDTVRIARDSVDLQDPYIPWRSGEEFATWCKFDLEDHWQLMQFSSALPSLLHTGSRASSCRDPYLMTSGNDVHEDGGDGNGYYRTYALFNIREQGLRSPVTQIYFLSGLALLMTCAFVVLHNWIVLIWK